MLKQHYFTKRRVFCPLAATGRRRFYAELSTDQKGKRVSFKETVIILTSNLEAEYGRFSGDRMGVFREEVASWDDAKEDRTRIDEEQKMRKQIPLPSELLNRIDECIRFHSLDQEHVEQIAQLQIKELQDRLSCSKNIDLRLTADAMKLLARKGYDRSDGARYLKRQIKRLVEDPLSDRILEEEVQDGSVVTADAANGELEFSV
jgi:ATP-dependent Clp protease ATP-binding subunit ClpC